MRFINKVTSGAACACTGKFVAEPGISNSGDAVCHLALNRNNEGFAGTGWAWFQVATC